jgi:hypothetical protein
MSELKACHRCNEVPELVDGRTKWFARCGCPAGDNVVYGQSVSFLDHISIDDDDELSDRVSDIVFSLVPWDELRQSAIDAWNTRAPQSEWISVSDRLPDADGRYLIVSHGGNIVTRMFYTHHDKSFFNRVVATHWMPLPLPPKEGLPC